MKVFQGLPQKHLYDTGDRIGRVVLDAERQFVSQDENDRACVDLVLRQAIKIGRKPRRVTAFSVFCDRGVSNHDFSVISFGTLTLYANEHTGSRKPFPQRRWTFFDRGQFRFDGTYLVVVSWQ